MPITTATFPRSTLKWDGERQQLRDWWKQEKELYAKFVDLNAEFGDTALMAEWEKKYLNR